MDQEVFIVGDLLSLSGAPWRTAYLLPMLLNRGTLGSLDMFSVNRCRYPRVLQRLIHLQVMGMEPSCLQ